MTNITFFLQAVNHDATLSLQLLGTFNGDVMIFFIIVKKETLPHYSNGNN